MDRLLSTGLVFATAIALACGAPARPDLIVLVTVDTLRADRLGAYGSDRGLSPKLDALAAESTVFRAAYAPASFTLPSLVAVFSGRHPREVGISSNESALAETVPTLAHDLRDRGWRTVAVVGNFVLRRQSGLAAGFDVYDDAFPDAEDVRGWPERIASDTTDAAISHLEECRVAAAVGCFLWIHYQDPHGPYTPPKGLREKHLAREQSAPDGARELPLRRDPLGLSGLPDYQTLGDERSVAFYRAGYDAEIEYMDGEIGRLFEAMRERGLWERTIVAFAADHGEGMGERDYWFAHGEYLTDGLVRVPFFLRVPGRSAEVRTDTVGLVDLRATVTGLLPDDDLPATEHGRNLLSPGAENDSSQVWLATLRAATRQRVGLVDGEYKFILTNRNGIWTSELYRRDGEGIDLAVAAPQLAAAMRQRVQSWQTSTLESATEHRQRLSDEDRAALRALGYTGDDGA